MRNSPFVFFGELSILTTTSFDDHTASRQVFLLIAQPDVRATTRRARRGVTSFSFKKEVTKKVNPDVPSGASLFVPRCKVEQERLHKYFRYSASTFVNTRGRRGKQGLLP